MTNRLFCLCEIRNITILYNKCVTLNSILTYNLSYKYICFIFNFITLIVFLFIFKQITPILTGNVDKSQTSHFSNSENKMIIFWENTFVKILITKLNLLSIGILNKTLSLYFFFKYLYLPYASALNKSMFL